MVSVITGKYNETSVFDYHDYVFNRLSENKKWKIFWMIVVGLAILALLAAFIYYSYQVILSHMYEGGV